MTGTQAALYAEIDLELSWSESALPQSERTKHVHGLHPYLGKFPPQLAEALIRRHCPAGGPRPGSVLRVGHDARRGDRPRPRRRRLRRLGLQRAARAREDARARRRAPSREASRRRSRAPRRCSRPAARRTPVPPISRSGTARTPVASCSRTAARSSPAARTAGSRRSCSPARRARPGSCVTTRSTAPASPCASPTGATSTAAPACRRRAPCASCAATRTTSPARVAAFGALRPPGAAARVHHLDARDLRLERPADALVTSPPYVGVIDYHDQHAYAYALLGLTQRPDEEIGSRSRGAGRARGARLRRRHGGRARRSAACLRPGAPLAIVVNDRLGALRRHPRARRAAARVAHAAPRQPAHEPARRGVLRGDPGRAPAAQA